MMIFGLHASVLPKITPIAIRVSYLPLKCMANTTLWLLEWHKRLRWQKIPIALTNKWIVIGRSRWSNEIDHPTIQARDTYLFSVLQSLNLFLLTLVQAHCGLSWACPGNTRRSSNVGLSLAHRLRRWPNISLTLGQRLVFAGWGIGITHHLSRQRSITVEFSKTRGCYVRSVYKQDDTFSSRSIPIIYRAERDISITILLLSHELDKITRSSFSTSDYLYYNLYKNTSLSNQQLLPHLGLLISQKY